MLTDTLVLILLIFLQFCWCRLCNIKQIVCSSLYIITTWCYAERGYATVWRLSIRPSVTFRYRDHIGWNTSTIISRPNSLRLTPRSSIWSNGWSSDGVMSTKPAISPKRCKIGPRLLYDGLIGSRIHAFDWYIPHSFHIRLLCLAADAGHINTVT